MNYEYDEIDLNHSSVLENLALTCHSNKRGFIENEKDKLNKIEELLQNSDYHLIKLRYADLYIKGNPSQIDYLISTHVDTVSNITAPFSKLDEKGYYSGTYDNLGTNAAAVITMLEADLPSNVAFAFTADEETGRCNGAHEVLRFIKSRFSNPDICIALDVTEEGYDEGCQYSLENLSSGNKKYEDREFLNSIGKLILSTEPKGIQTGLYASLGKKQKIEGLPKNYYSTSGGYDEAFAYINDHQRAFSFCLPSDGFMHSNKGMTVRQPVFEGYILSLQAILYTLTHTHEQRIENILIEKECLAGRISDLIKEEKEHIKYTYTPRFTSSFSDTFQGSYNIDDYDYFSTKSYVDDYYGDPENYPSFDDYKATVIDDILDSCFDGYDYNSNPRNREFFVNDALEMLPTAFINSYDTKIELYDLLYDMYESAFGLVGSNLPPRTYEFDNDYDYDESSSEDLWEELSNPSQDEDDENYQYSIEDYISLEDYE